MAGTTGQGVGLAALAAIAAGVLGAIATRDVAVPRRHPVLSRLSRNDPEVGARAARRLNASAALLSLSVLADSGIEHYRGMFHNRAMFLPLATAAATLASSLHGMGERTGEPHRVRHAIAATAATVGTIGGGFHLYNVTKRAGGVSWHNLFYGAPLGAPYSLILAGIMGTAAEHARHSRFGPLRLFGLRAGPALSAITAVGLAGTIAEVALLHFRGAFQDPFMYLPVTIPPMTAALMAKTAVEADGRTTPRWPRLTRAMLWITAALGFGGAGFHCFGVARNMGGWRNWSQNVLAGPPIPAPPAFTALAFAGLAALDIAEERR